jgi:hypothetical protein
MLQAWQQAYLVSGTTVPVTLLTDKQTPALAEWHHEVCRVPEDAPPNGTDVLHKVGWLKHQAFDLLGPSLVLDLDAFPETSLDLMQTLTAPIAMVPDPGPVKTWPWAGSWPAAARKYNAGVLWLNSPTVSQRFRELWTQHQRWMSQVTYFDEVIFSALMVELQGWPLPDRFNHHDGYPYFAPDAIPSVRHFSGAQRKEAMLSYVNDRLDLSARWV